jgi:hypothetical protein
MSDPAFRNQRTRFKNYSPPYADKVSFDPECPKEGVHPRGGVPSRKNERVVSFWTKGEYAAITLFEATPAILSYRERPERLRMRRGPKWYAYTPHFEVRTASGVSYVELSAAGKPVTERQHLIGAMAFAALASRGISFVELPHYRVRANPRFNDALTLMRYLSVQPGSARVIRATDALADGPETIAAVEERSGVSHGHLFAMLRTGTLEFREHGPIGLSTRIAIATGRAKK